MSTRLRRSSLCSLEAFGNSSLLVQGVSSSSVVPACMASYVTCEP